MQLSLTPDTVLSQSRIVIHGEILFHNTIPIHDTRSAASPGKKRQRWLKTQ